MLFLLLGLGCGLGSAGADSAAALRLSGQDAQLLAANFSALGAAPTALSGVLVELHPRRACQQSSWGLDRTLSGSVAVVLMSRVQPWISGCISPWNQVRFAADSGAIAVLLSAASLRPSAGRPPAPIPVLALAGAQADRLEAALKWARRLDRPISVHIRPGHAEAESESVQSSGPAQVDVGIVVLVGVLLVFAATLGLVKRRWRPRRADLSIEGLAKSALGGMETRKFRSGTKRAAFPALPGRPAPARPASSVLSAEACPICLDEYRDSQDLRVLPCGHEFHRACVDPWILLHRTCPLCQFDTVFFRYEGEEKKPPEMNLQEPSSSQPLIGGALPVRVVQSVPVVSVEEAGFFILGSASLPRGPRDPWRLPRPKRPSKADGRRRHSTGRKRARREQPRAVVAAAQLEGGYLSDISSLATDVRRPPPISFSAASSPLAPPASSHQRHCL